MGTTRTHRLYALQTASEDRSSLRWHCSRALAQLYGCRSPCSGRHFPPNSLDTTRWIPWVARCRISECTRIRWHSGIESAPEAQVQTQTRGVADERSNITEQPSWSTCSFLFFSVLCSESRGVREREPPEQPHFTPNENQRSTCTATIQLLAA